MKINEKTVRISNRQAYNHGCQNMAYLDNNGDGTFTVTDVVSCHSCWGVGHDSGYVYATVGDVWTEDQLLNSHDYRWELDEEEE